MFGVADAGEPGFVLGDEDVAVVRRAKGYAGDKGDGEGFEGGDGNVGGEFITVLDFWARWVEGFRAY